MIIYVCVCTLTKSVEILRGLRSYRIPKSGPRKCKNVFTIYKMKSPGYRIAWFFPLLVGIHVVCITKNKRTFLICDVKIINKQVILVDIGVF